MTARRYVKHEREILSKLWTQVLEPYPTGTPNVVDTYVGRSVHELIESQGHNFRELGKSDRDIGGDFMVAHKLYEESNSRTPSEGAYLSNNANEARHYSTNYVDPYAPGDHYHGGQWAYRADVPESGAIWPSAPYSSKSELRALGATAIARCIPTNPLSGLTTALGELKRDGLPSLWGASQLKPRTALARDAGSEYLNHEFGWVPLISDIRKFSKTYQDAERITDWYERNSGKRIKRRYVLIDTENVSTPVVLGSYYPVPSLQGAFYDSGQRDVTRTTTTRLKRWFSGCFTYYLAPRGTRERELQIANKLYGTRFTPETLWDLTPWSWAADWVTNIGDNIHNAVAFRNDGLVMPYAYMMETSSVTHEYKMKGFRYKSYNYPHLMTQSFTHIVKQRVKASPFGFGLDSGSFTSRQWSILAALGLSRSGSKLD